MSSLCKWWSRLFVDRHHKVQVQGVYFYENFGVPLQDSQVFTHLPPKSQILAELEQNTEREYMLGPILVTVLSVLFFSLFIKYLKLCIFCQYEILPWLFYVSLPLKVPFKNFLF